ncbi:methyltransferase domain-containing protein [Bradyrhizobium sp. 138]|uniref:class I SAM-dependent methyltransferase n=1 Tax=Bradyrhizobium sp. 138 TaxID=2782615 RepID=UPI001FF899E5|nr:methyltransferase domain-containing protein [Bradyrhizobium sp. 138]
MNSKAGWSDDLTKLHESAAGAGISIDVYSRDCGIKALEGRIPADASILELGSSSGFMLNDIRKSFPRSTITGSDFLPDVVERLRSISSERIATIDITSNDLPDCSHDAVVALNVFEHIDDDEEAAREVFRILKSGGIFYMEVPGGPTLYDAYDASLMHFRRYTRRSVRNLLLGAGFRLIEQSAIGFLAYPGFWATKKLNRLRFGISPNENLVRQSIHDAAESRLLSASIKLERRMRRFLTLPVGIRQTATAIKP